MRLPAALGALVLCGCEIYAVPDPIPCPDVRQGTFEFAGERVVLATDCFFSIPGNPANQITDPLPFTATISFVPGSDEAQVCKDVPHALPIVGTYSIPAMSIDVANEAKLDVGGCTCPSPDAAAAGNCTCPPNSTTCTCPVVQEQRITGALQPAAGPFTGFVGSLINTVRPPPGPVPPDVCDCQVACTYSYTLAATVVGPR